MADEEESLNALLNRATNPSNQTDDWEAIKNYATKINEGGDIQQTAIRLIAHKMQSPQEREAIQALMVLEHCSRACDRRFHNELGKFRFLNEMIKLVSPKYLGNRTPFRVKRKVIEIMYKWTRELQHEPKIIEAYQMLKQQGVITEDPVILDEYSKSSPPPRPRNAVFEDEEKSKLLQKLLQSKNAEDLQAANRLIKTMVKEDEKRLEKMSRRTTELETVNNYVKVLGDMLANYKSANLSPQDIELMKELYQNCEQLRPNLFRLANDMDEKDEGIAEILKANDDLGKVINQYKREFEGWTGDDVAKNNSNPLSLLDLGSPVTDRNIRPLPTTTATELSLLDDQLLGLGINDLNCKLSTSSHRSTSEPVSKGDLQELDDIFSNSLPVPPQSIPIISNVKLVQSNNLQPSTLQSATVQTNTFDGLGLLNSNLPTTTPMVRPLQPIPTAPVENSKPAQESAINPPKSYKGLEILDAIGQSLLKQSLPPTIEAGAEFPKTAEKIPLNQMAKKTDSAPGSPALQRATMGDTERAFSSTNSPSRSPAHEVASLANIMVPVETVTPGSLSPLTLYEKNGLNVVLHFGTNVPRPDVSVMVVTTISKNMKSIKNINFQAAVQKTMKVKLQPPSGTSLPAHNPILPPAAITQVMLVANPNKDPIRLKYKVAYTLDDEPISDTMEIESLPT